MDKLSAVLIACILALAGVNCMIIYNTCIYINNVPQVVDVMKESDKEGNGGNVSVHNTLAFNNDTSIECTDDIKLWIRVKVIYDDKYDAADYEIVSKAAEAGFWNEKDGWYYYAEPLTQGKTTMPLIDKLLYDGQSVEHGTTGRFRIQAEAVDEAWLLETPGNSQHAFKMFETLSSEQNIAQHL